MLCTRSWPLGAPWAVDQVGAPLEGGCEGGVEHGGTTTVGMFNTGDMPSSQGVDWAILRTFQGVVAWGSLPSSLPISTRCRPFCLQNGPFPRRTHSRMLRSGNHLLGPLVDLVLSCKTLRKDHGSSWFFVPTRAHAFPTVGPTPSNGSTAGASFGSRLHPPFPGGLGSSGLPSQMGSSTGNPTDNQEATAKETNRNITNKLNRS